MTRRRSLLWGVGWASWLVACSGNGGPARDADGSAEGRDGEDSADAGDGEDAGAPEDGFDGETDDDSGGGRTVTIDRDEQGTPIIYAGTLADAAYGLGHAMGRDHLEATLRQLLLAAGRLSEFLGEGPTPGSTSYLDADRKVHLVDMPGASESLYPTLDAGLRDYLESFAEGLDRAREEAIDAGTAPDWAPDYAPTGRDVFGLTRADAIFGQMAVAEGDVVRPPAATCPDLYTDASASNVWAATAPLAPPGRTVLLSDPHLPWDLDPLDGVDDGFFQYEAHLSVAGSRYGGSARLGSPLLGPGYSDSLAWGGTHSGIDTADVYLLTRVAPGGLDYYLGTEVRTLQARTVSFLVKEGSGYRTERSTVYDSAIGPVVEQGGNLYAAVLTMRDQPGSATTFWAMLAATTFDDALAHLDEALLQSDEKNLVVAGREGRIAYALAGRVPRRRAGEDYCHLLDAREAAALPFFDGTGAVEVAAAADHPVVEDPPTGYVVCNNTPPQTVTDFASYGVDPNDALPWHPGLYARPSDQDGGGGRQRKAREILDAAAAGSFDGAASVALAFDTEVWSWRAYRPILEALVAAHPELRDDPVTDAALDGMLAWDGRVTADAEAIFVFEGWAGRLDALPAPGRIRFASPPAPADLTAEQMAAAYEALVRDEAGLTDCERGAVPYLDEELDSLGGIGALLPWGDGHRLRLPGEAESAARPMPSGDRFLQTIFMSNAAWACPNFGLGFTDGGSSFMLSVDFDAGAADPADRLRVQIVKPIGDLRDPLDPRYGAMSNLFAAGTMREVSPSGPGPDAVVLVRP